MQKIVLLFPGVGYHTDKPLLFYGRKLAQNYGYETVISLSYGGFKGGIKGNPEKMKEAFESALSQSEEIFRKECKKNGLGITRFSSSPRASARPWRQPSSNSMALSERTSILLR